MTLHIDAKNFVCSRCSVEFIPFKKDFKCPNCGELTDEFFDFIPEVISAMRYHKQRYGSFMPPAWYTGSLNDHIESIIFKIFDTIEIKKPENLEMFTKKYLDNGDWCENDYLHKHVEEITLSVLQIYQSDKSSQEKGDVVLETKPIELGSKKWWFRMFLP